MSIARRYSTGLRPATMSRRASLRISQSWCFLSATSYSTLWFLVTMALMLARITATTTATNAERMSVTRPPKRKAGIACPGVSLLVAVMPASTVAPSRGGTIRSVKPCDPPCVMPRSYTSENWSGWLFQRGHRCLVEEVLPIDSAELLCIVVEGGVLARVLACLGCGERCSANCSEPERVKHAHAAVPSTVFRSCSRQRRRGRWGCRRAVLAGGISEAPCTKKCNYLHCVCVPKRFVLKGDPVRPRARPQRTAHRLQLAPSRQRADFR